MSRRTRGSGAIRNRQEERPWQVRYTDDDGRRRSKTFKTKGAASTWLGDRDGEIGKRSIAKKWEARYRGSDGRFHSRSFANKADAETWLRHQLAALDKGEWVSPQGGKETVADVYEAWLRGVKSKGRKPKTVAGYESLWRSRVGSVWESHQLRQVTTRGVREWIEDMATDGLSPARQRAALQLLGAIFRRAVADGLVPRSPLDALLPDDRPEVRQRRQLFLNHFQVKALADAAEECQDGMGTFVYFLAYSGCRWGEATALRAGSIERNGGDRAKVSITEAYADVNGELHLGEPKTHEQRTIILPARVARMLFDHIEGMEADDLVFTAPMGGVLRTSNFRLSVWLPACEAADMPDGLLVHDLRDTAASLAISSGASILAVQRMLGHRDASMTLNTYGSLYEEDLEDLADRLDAAIPSGALGS